VPISHRPSRGRARRVAFIPSFACALALIAPGLATAGPRSMIGPYFGAPFKSTKTPFALGQAGSWSRDGKVLATLLDSAGIQQVYRIAIDGSSPECLTCTTVAGPNGFAQERAQGDWILFASYGQQPVHTGGPGFGGYGVSLVLFVIALRGLGTARTGAYFSVAPVFGVALSLAMWPQAPGASFWIAAALMTLGVWLHVRERHEHEHTHERLEHTHRHVHDEHHRHVHDFPYSGDEPHTHPHVHLPITHSHAHFPDIHHRHAHRRG